MKKEFYMVSPEISILQLEGGGILFKSDTLAIKLEGESVSILIENVFPLLDGKHSILEIQNKTNIDQKELAFHLNKLVDIGVVRIIGEPGLVSSNFNNFLKNINFPQGDSDKVLSEVKIAIVGLEGEGVLIAKSLLSSGVKNIVLFDPFLIQPENTILISEYSGFENRRTRQEVICEYLNSIFLEKNISIFEREINKDTINELVSFADLFISCFDKGFKSVHYWLNSACVKASKSVVFSEISGHTNYIGPFVIPYETACYMCYRMRHMATEGDFSLAMMYEKHLNNQRNPELKNRAFLHSAINYNSSILSSEILRYILSIGMPSLASKVLEFNSLNLETKMHHILQVPECKVCQKKKSRELLPLNNLVRNSNYSSDIGQYEEILTSKKTGIITMLELFNKDIGEPTFPYIFRADLSNNRFSKKNEELDNVASGKGLSLQSAKISAMGEAVERYSGTCHRKDEVSYLSYNHIQQNKLDPNRLVLFEKHQYNNIEFTPYSHDNVIGWVDAYSLLNELPIKVPAVSIFMNYEIQNKEEYICPITSNGLAAGKTLLDSIIAAALEIIERDAFIISWHGKLKCQRINPFSLPNDEIKRFLISYQRKGVEFCLFRLPTDSPCHIFMAVGIQKEGDGPYAVVGLGADFDPLISAKSALLEVGQVRPAVRKRIRQKEVLIKMHSLVENPRNVKELDDHDLLFASPAVSSSLNFLFETNEIDFNFDSNIYSIDQKISLLLGYVKSIKSDLIYFNLTPDDMKKLGLYTSRVIIPDLQPIHFGFDNIRLGGERLFNLGTQLGLQKHPIEKSNLDLFPHPLA